MPTAFPATKEGLFSYLSGVVPYAETNKVRLLISVLNMTALTTLYGDSATPGTYLYYYALWSQPGSGRTKDVIDNLVSTEKSIKSLLLKIYNDIPASVWTNEDRNAFNRRTGLPLTHTKPTSPIPEQCYVHITFRGGGDLKFNCRATLDSTRASMPKGANGVEFAFRIDSPQFVPPIPAVIDGAGNDLASKIKRDQMISPKDATDHQTYPKAGFVVKLGPENAGNNLQFFARFINTHYPGLEGPWTGPVSVMIS
jgi:hypothetical protein